MTPYQSGVSPGDGNRLILALGYFHRVTVEKFIKIPPGGSISSIGNKHGEIIQTNVPAKLGMCQTYELYH